MQLVQHKLINLHSNNSYLIYRSFHGNKTDKIQYKIPSTRSRVSSKTDTFLSEYGDRPYVTGAFCHQKRGVSNTLSTVETFENGDLLYSCGRVNTEVFKYDDVLPRLPHIQFKNATCGCYIF